MCLKLKTAGQEQKKHTHIRTEAKSGRWQEVQREEEKKYNLNDFPFAGQRRKHFNDVYTVSMCHSICRYLCLSPSVSDSPSISLSFTVSAHGFFPRIVVLCALFRLTRTFHYARRSTLVDDIIAAIQKVFHHPHPQPQRFCCYCCHFISELAKFFVDERNKRREQTPSSGDIQSHWMPCDFIHDTTKCEFVSSLFA